MNDERVEELIEEYDLGFYPFEAIAVYLEEHEDLEDFEDAYCGEYEGRDEYAAIGNYLEELEEEMGLDDLPERFRYYIDWYHMGRDARYNGEFWAESHGYRWYVFRTY